jgi:SAM-dependent methyltransferase
MRVGARQQPDPVRDVWPVVCLGCGGVLVPGAERWCCPGCGLERPAVLGIPDLRPRPLRPPPAEIARLVEAFPRASFAELVELRRGEFTTDDPGILAAAAEYRAKMGPRGRAFLRMVRTRLSQRWPAPGPGPALVIGCGAGSAMLELARTQAQVVGVDPDLADLILARKAAQEQGLADRITLVQGYAQALPLAPGAIDLAIAEDVLEHVIDLERTMAELGRVLAPGGQFAGNCVNRYNLLRPEPHVRLWFVGFLPRRLQGRWVLWRRRFRGYDETVRLPSWRELRRALARVGGEARVVFPGVEPYGLPPSVDRVLGAAERLGPLALPLLWVFPVLLAIARADPAASAQPGGVTSARSARRRV